MNKAKLMDEQRITIYTPDSLLSNPLKMLREMLRDLAASRELAWRLDGARSERPISANLPRISLGHHIAFGQYAGLDLPESQRRSECQRNCLALSGLCVHRHNVVGDPYGCGECTATNGHCFQKHARKNQFSARGTCGRRHIPDVSQCADQGRIVVDCIDGNGDPPRLGLVAVTR